MRALESRFENGFFRVAEFLMARQAACHRFEVKRAQPGRRHRGGAAPAGRRPLPPGRRALPRATATTRPRLQRQGPPAPKAPPPPHRAAHAAPARRGHGRRVPRPPPAHRPGLPGRRRRGGPRDPRPLQADARGGAPGPREGRPRGAGRRARCAGSRCRAPAASKTTAGAGGPAANFALKRADVRDMLAAMTDLDPSLAALGPEGHLGRASLWAKDVPLLDLRAALLDGVGLKERLEEGRRIVERATGAEERLVPVAAAATERRLIVEPRDMAVLELELAGVASAGTTWLAFAYVADGRAQLLPRRRPPGGRRPQVGRVDGHRRGNRRRAAAPARGIAGKVGR